MFITYHNFIIGIELQKIEVNPSQKGLFPNKSIKIAFTSGVPYNAIIGPITGLPTCFAIISPSGSPVLYFIRQFKKERYVSYMCPLLRDEIIFRRHILHRAVPLNRVLTKEPSLCLQLFSKTPARAFRLSDSIFDKTLSYMDITFCAPRDSLGKMR